MGRNLAVAGLLAALDRTNPAPSRRPPRETTRLASLDAARLVASLQAGPRAAAFVFLIDPDNAFEMRPGEFSPARLWHFCATRRRWVSVPAPAIEQLMPWYAALQVWVGLEADAERGSEATRTAEALLADQSGLTVIPSTHLPTLIEAGMPVVEALVRAHAAADAPPDERGA